MAADISTFNLHGFYFKIQRFEPGEAWPPMGFLQGVEQSRIKSASRDQFHETGAERKISPKEISLNFYWKFLYCFHGGSKILYNSEEFMPNLVS